ncbi:MAG: hypothetical protein LC663_04665, partial [Actinobacteria bacterium]|nr:hypothetical protein [Actinomycetota bacterium]
VVAAVLVLVTRTTPTPAGRARSYARQACARAAGFERLVDRNAPAPETQDALARALASAQSAQELDPAWLPLASGLRTVQLALQRDDAGAANVGMRVVLGQCGNIK